MKNLISAMAIMLGLGFSAAQQARPATSARPAQTQYDQKTKTVSAKPVTPKPAAPGMKLKKDGTPDKRYKQNQHLKKDGTIDKRFKNK